MWTWVKGQRDVHTPPIALAVDFGDETFIADYLGQAPNYTPNIPLFAEQGNSTLGAFLPQDLVMSLAHSGPDPDVNIDPYRYDLWFFCPPVDLHTTTKVVLLERAVLQWLLVHFSEHIRQFDGVYLLGKIRLWKLEFYHLSNEIPSPLQITNCPFMPCFCLPFIFVSRY